MRKEIDMHKHMSLIYGIGINDADYMVYQRRPNKSALRCNFYATWCGILQRCNSPKWHSRHPTYSDCKIDERWIKFSEFKRWMESNNWDGKFIDKDIIIKGNKIYSPDACAFVDRATNNFLLDSGAKRGDYPIGVNFSRKYKKFTSSCNNPFTLKKEHLGSFDCHISAHKAWAKRKSEFAFELAKNQDDKRVSEALIKRFSIINQDLDHYDF